MERDDLRRACEEPAHRVGLTLEDGLIDDILEDVGREPGLLPLMEDALLQLWERRRGDQVLTLQAYRELGGVRGALAQKADTLFTSLSLPQQTIARRVFLRLTRPGEGHGRHAPPGDVCRGGRLGATSGASIGRCPTAGHRA